MNKLSVLACIVIPFGLLACRHDTGPRPAVGVFEGDVIEAGKAWGLAPGCVVLDVRPDAAYSKAHLPGAVHVDEAAWKEASFAAGAGLGAAETWHARFGSLGIDGSRPVLVYDAGEMKRAARVWFLLRHFGARAAVVNGGFPALEATRPADVPFSWVRTRPWRRAFVPDEGAAAEMSIGLLEREQVKAAVAAGEAQVLDVRTQEEYRGVDLRDNARGGHLPSALNLPHDRLLDEAGRLRGAEELRRLFADAGFEPGRPIISHCDGGGRASLGALAAARAGYGPVYNYYLSFGDWAADATCPLVRD